MKKTLLSIVLVLFVAAGLFAANRFVPRPTSEAVGTPQRQASPQRQIANVVRHDSANTTASINSQFAQPPTVKVNTSLGEPAVRVSQSRFAHGVPRIKNSIPVNGFKPLRPRSPNANVPISRARNVQISPASNVAPISSLKPNTIRRPNPGFAPQQTQNWSGATRPPITNQNGLASFTNTNIRKPTVAPRSSLPSNATAVKNLVRANYRLPLEAAKTLESFFGLDAKQNIETVINGDESQPLVDIQITTGADTQRAVAVFLNAVYSPERLEKIKVEAAKPKEVSTSSHHGPTTNKTTDEVLDELLDIVDQTEKTVASQSPTIIPPVETNGTSALPSTTTPVDGSDN